MTNNNITPANINLLYSDRFEFVFRRIPNAIYRCYSIDFPAISINPQRVATPHGSFNVGGKMVDYGTLGINFRIDEDFLNYEEIMKWMIGIAGSVDPVKYRELVNVPDGTVKTDHAIYSDGTLVTLTNASNYNVAMNFVNLFPISLSPPTFDMNGSQEVINVSATFAFDYFEIIRKT